MCNLVNHPKKFTLKGVLQTLVGILVFAIIFYVVSEICRDKSGDRYILTPEQTSEQQIEVVFAGSSHMNNAAYPLMLWEKYGITSYNHAQSGQILPVSYYACKDAIELYHPKVLVLDVYMLYHAKKTGNITWMHQSFDRMSFSNRLQGILDLIPREQWKEFLVPLTLYHARWESLLERDFTFDKSALDVNRGCSMNFTHATDITGLTLQIADASEKIEPPEIAVEYLIRIAELCQETGTELLLVALPYFTSDEVDETTHNMSKDQAYFNWVSDFAAEYGANYINYFHIVDEIGFNWYEHLFNYSHMNYWGGCVITEHLGEYLYTHYDLEDYRDNPLYDNWNEDLERFHQSIENSLQKAADAQ